MGRSSQFKRGSADLYVFGSPKNTEGYQFSKTFFGVIFENTPNLEESLSIKHAAPLNTHIKGEKDFFGNPDWDPATSMTLVFHFCNMSSVRSTSDGRGPVTRKRVPDREEQGKPRKDARRGCCHPLE